MTASTDPIPASARRGIAVAMLAGHVALAWALLQVAPVREAAREIAPLLVDLIVPAPPVPRPTVPRPAPAAAARTQPAPPPVVAAPPAPPETPAPAMVVPPPVAPAPVAAPVAAPQDAPPATSGPTAPPAPRQVAITAVAYLAPPVLAYPPEARRAREEGIVHVGVLVDADGRPREWAVLRTSGHARLDDAALATVRATRFRPYTENGVALPFRVVMPLLFELR